MERNDIIRTRHDRKCSVCGEPAHLFSPDSEPVCLRPECKHVLSKKQHMNEIAYKRYFALQAEQIKRTMRQAALKKKRMEEKRRKEKEEYVACMMSTIKEVHGYDPAIYPCTVMSKNTRKIGKLPKRREKLFQQFLSTLVNEAFSEIEDNKGNKNETPYGREVIEDAYPFEAKACAVCRGVCCTRAENKAYLRKETILRYLSEHSGQKPGHVLAAYMAYLAETTYVNSCVYHTETGCCLPRAMRSDSCNEFFCDALNELNGHFTKTPMPKGVFLIDPAPDNWRKDILNEGNSIVLPELILNDGEGD